MTTLLSLLLPLAFTVACSAFADGARPCRIDNIPMVECEQARRCHVDELLPLVSTDLSAYERVALQVSDASAEGANVTYYYKGPQLVAVRSVYYGETGRTEIEYVFSRSPAVYAAAVSGFFYSAPISVVGSQTATVNRSEFAVCDGALVRGISNDVVVGHFERARTLLNEVLAKAPR